MKGRKREKEKNPSAPRPAAVYHSAVLSAAALLFFRRRRPPPAPFICGRWLGSISATDGHGIIFPAAKIGFSRLRSLTFPPSLLLPSNPDQLNHLRPFCCPRCWSLNNWTPAAMAVDSSLARLKKVSFLRPWRWIRLLQG